MEAPRPQVPPRSRWSWIRSLPLATLAGLALVVLFLVFCKIDDYAVRWRIMLPLAAAAGGLLLWRRKRVSGLESWVCTAGLCLLAALFLLRDIGMSKKLAELLDKVNRYKTEVNQISTEFNRFFGRPTAPPR